MSGRVTPPALARRPPRPARLVTALTRGPHRAEPPTDPKAAETKRLGTLRRIGQGIGLPVAAMPIAGVLLRLGQNDLLGGISGFHRGATVISAAGSSVLDNLPILFAIGVALGMRRREDTGQLVLASVVSYLVLSRAVLALNPLPADQAATPPARWPYGALTGIIAALLAKALWSWLHQRPRIPPFAAYALIALAALTAGAALGLGYPTINHALTASASSVADHPVIGGAIFGATNRLLLPFGLHNVGNAVVWYLVGDCGNGIRGDIPCFFIQHDPHAGIFMTGFFPVALAGLPAAALAMWRSAAPENRRRTGALLLPAAAMSTLTGITEPIELSFAFSCPQLYLLHALLTGTSLAVVNALDIHSGFTFSAGLLDFGFNYRISRRPLLLLPISIVYGAVYYTVFRFAITKFNLNSPGRLPAPAAPAGDVVTAPLSGEPDTENPEPVAGFSDEPLVKTIHYGRGAFIPAVILDRGRARWRRPLPGDLPERSPAPDQLLAVRWTGPESALATAPILLEIAARRAPADISADVLASVRDGLPDSLRIVTVPASAVIGSWAQRPGGTTPAPRYPTPENHGAPTS